MSVDELFIYLLIPTLGWMLIRINRIEKKMLMLIVMLRDRGFKMPRQTDTERYLKNEL
jgi:hypothetical protein